jgi:hypothetical protein
MVLPIIFMMILTACQTTQPGIEVREVPVPTPVPCVNEADIPPEPPQVGDQFNGDAKHDLGILAPNALALRIWGRTLWALIVPGCTVVD